MDLQVRDLLEHLQTYPPETRLRFVVCCVDGTEAAADNYEMRRDNDGVHEIVIAGALVKQLVQETLAEGEPG